VPAPAHFQFHPSLQFLIFHLHYNLPTVHGLLFTIDGPSFAFNGSRFTRQSAKETVDAKNAKDGGQAVHGP
jgi:hypothetical protein